MNKTLSIALLLVSSLFADTIYLRSGNEVKDATITEIGVSDVKYKVGAKEVVYIVNKSDIAIIFYNDGSKEVFEAESKNNNSDNSNSTDNNSNNAQGMQNIQNTVIVGGANKSKTSKYQNFTRIERRATWALNALTINGVGSWIVMGDVLGGFAHFGLGAATVALFLNDNNIAGIAAFSSGAIWNLYRSSSYDKPKKVAYSEYSNFNFAVLPNKHGNLNAYLMYNKAF